METEFQLRFQRSDIKDWAKEYMCNENNRQAALADKKLEAEVLDDIKRNHCCTLLELQELCRWKYGCWSKHYRDNTEDQVVEVTREAFALDDDVERLRTLTRLCGVAWRTASAILHWYTYSETPGLGVPVIDFRTLWSVGKLQKNGPCGNLKWDDPELWRRYAAFCRSTSRTAGVTMRELDRALWMYSKVKSEDRLR